MTEDPIDGNVLHILPTDDLSRPALYLSRQRLPGMIPVQDLAEPLYGYPMRGRAMQGVGLGGDELRVGVGTGACVQEWVHGDTGIQWVQHGGMCGRSIQSTFFVTKPGFHSNPTQAGSKFDSYMGGELDLSHTDHPPRNFGRGDWIQGSRVLEILKTPGSIRLTGIPLEWDPDGQWPGYGQNFGGGVLAAYERSSCRCTLEISSVRPGLFKVRSIGLVAHRKPLDDYRLVWEALTVHPCFGFDAVIAVNGDTGEQTDLRQHELTGWQLFSYVSEWTVFPAFLRGTLDAPHHRQPHTRQTVLLNGTPTSVVFYGADWFRIAPAPPSSDFTTPTLLEAPSPRAASWEAIQMRYGFSNRVDIGGGTGKFLGRDETGSYPDDVLGTAGAIIYRARADSDRPWSFTKDFCVGMWVPSLTEKSDGHNRFLRWASKRSKDVPTHGADDLANLVLAHTQNWLRGTQKPPNGMLETVQYLLVGSWEQTQSNLEWLRANG